MLSEVISVLKSRFVPARTGLIVKLNVRRLGLVLAAALAFTGLTPGVRGQSPATISGTTFGLAVADGTSPFASSGYYFLIAGDTASSFRIANILATTNSFGTYAYTSDGVTAQLVLTNSGFGKISDEIIFSDNYYGSYTLTDTVSAGQQHGNFIWFNGQSPASVAGKTFACSINDGTEPFSANGLATIRFAASGNSYSITLDEATGVDSTGTYSYARLNTATSRLSMNDSKAGTITAIAAFSDQWSGSFGISKDASDSYQVGDFTILDETIPRIEITSPNNSRSISNEIITISGRASDNASIASAFCSINGSDWLVADTTNNYLNWSVSLILTPGTNVFSARSVDSSGNTSLTNTVRYVYVVSSQLNVVINGRGSVNPAYNNARLQIGANYTMKAIPAVGYKFTGWTDNSGYLLANQPPLNFNMVPGLTLTANFADTARPSVTITTPSVGQRWSNDTFNVTGKATDNDRIVQVYYSVNDSAWFTAGTGNYWTNWLFTTQLTPGNNRIKTYAVDASGNVSLTNQVDFKYILSAPISVRANAGGRFSPRLNGAMLAIGQRYSLTATASNGFAFSCWMDANGTIITNKPSVSFVMASNLDLRAVFIDSLKPSVTFFKRSSEPVFAADSYLIRGRATDNAGVAGVYYKLNDGSWQTAQTFNGWIDWTATINLLPGTNWLFAYGIDTSGNASTTNATPIIYSTAPVSLFNKNGEGISDSTRQFSISFGAKTFGHFSTDANYFNGVGTYSYTRLTPSTARLRVKYTSPPLAASAGSGDYILYFSNPNSARFINNNTLDTGNLSLNFSPSLIVTSLVRQTLFYINSLGAGKSTYFYAGRFYVTDLLTGSTNDGKTLSYSLFSPLNTLIRQTNGNGLTYTVTKSIGTNFGAAYVERYNPDGSLFGTDTGHFGFASQRVDGNAPAELGDQSLSISSGNSWFRLSFFGDTFSQQSASDSFDTGVGLYRYALADTNTGNLSLSFTAPANLNGSSSSTALSFYAPNLAYLVNPDNTISAATLSRFVNASASAPVDKTISAVDTANGITSQFHFSGDGFFSYSRNSLGAGSYTYNVFSPETSMIQMTFNTGDYAGYSGSLQLDYSSTDGGNFKTSVFDGANNLLNVERGNFSQP
jgi:Divergent InlB B-repeat domain/Bacterial Ig domain